MTREIVTLDVTEIEDREWEWSAGRIRGASGPRFAAYVHYPNPKERSGWTARQGMGGTPQEALDNAYREALSYHCAVCYAPLGASDGDCCSFQCEVEREARKVLA